MRTALFPKKLNPLVLSVGAALLLPLCACASYAWSKAGATEQEFAKDNRDCKKSVESRHLGSGPNEIFVRGLERKCLLEKGWVQRQKVNSSLKSTETSAN